MRILLIDTWSKGLKFFQPVITELGKIQNIDVTFLHANSLYAPNLPVDNSRYLRMIDISTYDHSIHKFLVDNKFDVALFVSSHDVFHRWANSVLSFHQIPCFHYMHGMRFQSSTIKQRRGFLTLIKRVFLYSKQGLFITADQLRTTKKDLVKVIYIILHSMVFRSAKKRPAVKSWGLNYRSIFLNFEGDRAYYKIFLGSLRHSTQSYIVSGNVLSHFDYGLKKKMVNLDSNVILFISQPFYSSGHTSATQYIDDILSISQTAKDLGFKLKVRPHPSDTEEFKSLLAISNLKIDDHTELCDAVYNARLTIGVNSAALIGVIRARCKLLVLRLNYASELPDYMFDPKVCMRSELSDLKQNLQTLLQSPSDDANKYEMWKNPSSVISSEVMSYYESLTNEKP